MKKSVFKLAFGLMLACFASNMLADTCKNVAPGRTSYCEIKSSELRNSLAALGPAELATEWEKLCPRQKQAVWNDKFTQVLSLPWSAEESSLIRQIASKATDITLYEGNAVESPLMAEIETLFKEGSKKYGWTSTTQYWMMATLEDMPDSVVGK